MSPSRSGSRSRRAGLACALALPMAIALLLLACGSPAGSASGLVASPTAPTSEAVPSPAGLGTPSGGSGALTHLTIGLGYIPSIQFAQFYLAQQAGYYRDAGLDVTFENKVDPDLVVLVGQGALDAGISDGTSVIPAVSQGIPIRYVATIYGTFPNIVFAKASSGIATAADLKGKRIGTPCRCGSSWIMLEALLSSAGLSTTDVQVVEYPDYSQEAAVARGAVDAATGYTNNEPLQLQSQGQAVTELHVDQAHPPARPGSDREHGHDRFKGRGTARLHLSHAACDGRNRGRPAAGASTRPPSRSLSSHRSSRCRCRS